MKPDANAVIMPAKWGRRAAAMALDMIVMWGIAGMLSVLTLLFYIRFTGDDFDGPPEAEVKEGWFMTLSLSSYALLHTSIEGLLGFTIGKSAVGLRVTGNDGGFRLKLRLTRWLIKTIPLWLMLCIACCTYVWIVLHTDQYYWAWTGRFVKTMSILVWAVPAAALAVQGIYIVARGGETLHDRLARTYVSRVVYYPASGFEPIFRCRAPSHELND